MSSPSKLSDYLLGTFLVITGLLLLTELAYSLEWPILHDTPILHYIAFLIDKHDYVPYRDIFEASWPLSYLIHLGIGKTVGYGELAFRIIDIVSHLGLLAITVIAMSRINRRVAYFAAIIFGLYYMQLGPHTSLQRDYMAILPLMAAVLLAGFETRRIHLKACLIGALLALSSSIKPHMAIGFPVVFFYMLFEMRDRSASEPASLFYWIRKAGLWCLLSYFLLMSLPLLWVWRLGGLADFFAIQTSYIPLYLQLNGDHELVTGLSRWIYLGRTFLEGMRFWLLPAGFGLFIALFNSTLTRKQYRFVLMLALLTLLYSIYPAISGQFWQYHWFPFRYFFALCLALLLTPAQRPSLSPVRDVFLSLFFIVFVSAGFFPSPFFFKQIKGYPPVWGEITKRNEMAAFLQKARLQPDDRVQPLDWVGGATLHAMLEAKARIATPFIYDAQFYHHVSEPYIQKLRLRFIKQMLDNPPRFIIKTSGRPQPKGPDTTTEFPLLQEFMNSYYTVAHRGYEFIVFEHQESL